MNVDSNVRSKILLTHNGRRCHSIGSDLNTFSNCLCDDLFCIRATGNHSGRGHGSSTVPTSRGSCILIRRRRRGTATA